MFASRDRSSHFSVDVKPWVAAPWEAVGEAELLAGERCQGIAGWTHRGRWAGRGSGCAPKEHIGPIDPDASTLNQFLKLFTRD